MPSLFVFLLANALSSTTQHAQLFTLCIAMMAVWNKQLKMELEGKIAISVQIVPLVHMWY